MKKFGKVQIRVLLTLSCLCAILLGCALLSPMGFSQDQLPQIAPGTSGQAKLILRAVAHPKIHLP